MIKEKLLAELEGKAEGAFVIRDLEDQKTWASRENEVISSASLIKLFILAEAMRCIKEGSLRLGTKIPVQHSDVVPFSVLEFLEPRTYSLAELLRLMIVYSDNTATNVLIEFLGMIHINQCIHDLGFEKSVLQRKMMDFEAAKLGSENLTTAGEMAEFMQRLYDGRLLGAPYDGKMLEIMKGQADECMMRVWLPDEITIARKSGELDALDHDVAIVYGEKKDYMYCFFVWDAASNNDAREILARTSKITYDFFEENK